MTLGVIRLSTKEKRKRKEKLPKQGNRQLQCIKLIVHVGYEKNIILFYTDVNANMHLNKKHLVYT